METGGFLPQIAVSQGTGTEISVEVIEGPDNFCPGPFFPFTTLAPRDVNSGPGVNIIRALCGPFSFSYFGVSLSLVPPRNMTSFPFSS